jgi:hypothetical protein
VHTDDDGLPTPDDDLAAQPAGAEDDNADASGRYKKITSLNSTFNFKELALEL